MTTSSIFERRLRAEWNLLQELAVLNPERITGLQADDATFHATLCAGSTPAKGSGQSVKSVLRWENALSQWQAHPFFVHYPVHFPAVPMELYLEYPVRHPNIHPETGFVCLWERHRASNTVEHAVHKLAAMLDGRLFNPDVVHVMQPDALLEMHSRETNASYAPLLGVAHDASLPAPAPVRRRRLQ